MSERVGLVLCREAGIYDLGPQHPLKPERVLLTWDLIEAYQLDLLPNVESLGCRSATDAELELVHTREYIDATRRAGHGEDGDWSRFGYSYGMGDNPIFPMMHEAGALAAGASLVAAERVWDGTVEHSFNAAGGLHHAMPARASGFCIYDDPALAIARLLELGAERVAYVDVDVHHGDGPQAIFYQDPRVLTISLHEEGIFPGTGAIDEIGHGDALGTAVNVPFPAGVTDEGWLKAFRAVVPPLVRAFRPDVLVTQLGCDTHVTDPLAGLRLTTRSYREAARELHDLAHRAAGGRWVATGGGGYQWATVVPRAWTIYFGEMCGAELPDELPPAFLEEIGRLLGGTRPAALTDEPIEPSGADGTVDELIREVRRTVFSIHGIGPQG